MGWLEDGIYREKGERFVSIFIRFCAGPFNIMAWRGNLFHCTVCCSSPAIIHNNNKVFSVSPPAPRARQQQPNSQPRGKFNIGHYRTASLSRALVRSLACWHIKTSARRTAADGYRFYQTTVKHGRRHRGFELLPGVIWILQPRAIIAIEGERFKNVCRHRRVLSALAELFIVINSLITLWRDAKRSRRKFIPLFYCSVGKFIIQRRVTALVVLSRSARLGVGVSVLPASAFLSCYWRCIVQFHCPLWCVHILLIDDKDFEYIRMILNFSLTHYEANCVKYTLLKISVRRSILSKLSQKVNKTI
jgi:hypothetical protein